MLSDVTMIIATKDRQITMQEILDYYAGTGLHVIVADGSASPMESRSVQRDGLRATYMHNPGAGIVERVALAQKCIETPFAMLRADRRHVSSLGLRSACDFLAANSDYSTAQGKWYVPGPTGIFPFYTAYSLSPVAEIDDPKERTRKTMAIYVPIIYAVFRRDAFLTVWSALSGFPDCGIAELYVNYTGHEPGKAQGVTFPVRFCGSL